MIISPIPTTIKYRSYSSTSSKVARKLSQDEDWRNNLIQKDEDNSIVSYIKKVAYIGSIVFLFISAMISPFVPSRFKPQRGGILGLQFWKEAFTSSPSHLTKSNKRALRFCQFGTVALLIGLIYDSYSSMKNKQQVKL